MEKQATFGGGCFWCIEPIFNQLQGVKKVYPGYAGGHTENPTYDQVCQHDTGHVEVIRIVFDDNEVSYDKLLEIFWFVHNPTTINQQGNDLGEQYRSVIFFHDLSQEELALKYRAALNASEAFDTPVVTAIEPLVNFFSAENLHHDFYNNNPDVPYCQAVIRPKVDKFKAAFSHLLK